MKTQTIIEHGIMSLIVLAMMGIGLSFAVHAEQNETSILESAKDLITTTNKKTVVAE